MIKPPNHESTITTMDANDIKPGMHILVRSNDYYEVFLVKKVHGTTIELTMCEHSRLRWWLHYIIIQIRWRAWVMWGWCKWAVKGFP